jgi:threonine aldolase
VVEGDTRPAYCSRLHMAGDGIPLTPCEYGELLTRLSAERSVAVDDYSIGGIVAEFEEQAAGMLGKEDAAILPTGTMANVLALEALAGRGGRVIVPYDSHIYRDSGDAAQCLAGLNLIPVPGGFPDEVGIRTVVGRAKEEKVEVPVKALLLESPVRRLHEGVYPLEQFENVIAAARNAGLRLHLDGARLFIWSVWCGKHPAELSSSFETVYVSLFKYFNTLFGAVLAGPRDIIGDVRRWRRRNGGALPRIWPVALVARHFMDGFLERLARARQAAEDIFSGLNSLPGLAVHKPPNGTNAALLTWDGATLEKARALKTALKERGIHLPDYSEPDGGFWIKVNETWNNIPQDTVISSFREVLSSQIGVPE